MSSQRITRLRRRIAQLRLRKANVGAQELRRLALSIGRRPGKRGKEPTFVMKPRPPLTIPHHGKMRKINKNTVGDILDQLEEDLDYLEEMSDV